MDYLACLSTHFVCQLLAREINFFLVLPDGIAKSSYFILETTEIPVGSKREWRLLKSSRIPFGWKENGKRFATKFSLGFIIEFLEENWPQFFLRKIYNNIFF